MREYVLIDSEKRNFGMKGLEAADFVLATIGILIFLILALGLNQIAIGIYFIIGWLFLLAPINISNKNRIYKIVIMIILYLLNNHLYIYESDKKEGKLNEYNEKIKNIRNKFVEKFNNE